MARSDDMRSLRFATRTVADDRALVLAEARAAEVDAVVEQGADIVVLPDADAVAAVRARHPATVIGASVTTPEAAERACASGAELLADAGPGVAEVAASRRVGLLRRYPWAPGRDPGGRVRQLAELGVPEAATLIEPITEDLPLLLHHVDELARIALPLLLGLDGVRAGAATSSEPEAAAAAIAIAAAAGVRVVRTRHVLAARRVVEMTASIVGTRPPARALRALA